MSVDIGHLRLKELVFWGRHGYLPFERESGNRFEVDVDIEADLADAVKSDRMESTVDLAQVYEIIRNHVEGEPRTLIESLAGVIAEEITALEKALSCTVRVRKMSPPLPGATGGVMEAEVTRVA